MQRLLEIVSSEAMLVIYKLTMNSTKRLCHELMLIGIVLTRQQPHHC